jgi:hypothetical protein
MNSPIDAQSLTYQWQGGGMLEEPIIQFNVALQAKSV